LGEGIFSLSNYIAGNGHDGASLWYFWPAMQGSIIFYDGPPGTTGGNIVFTGNLILWLAATFAVIAALAVALRHFFEHKREKADHRAFFILLTGYAIAMLPFLSFVHRSTFLYHYLPALIFAFGLLAWFITHWLKVNDWSDLSRRTWFILGAITLIVVVGFLCTAPVTYGL
jgi:dolichyl-phosphate-mannose--protein O-mannosyl transferase